MAALRRPLLTVAACCFLLTGAAIGVGHLLPAPPGRSVLARNPCALPCFYGVTPGLTTRFQAMDALAHYVDPARVGATTLTFPMADYGGRVVIALIDSNADGWVESLRLSAVYWAADIGQLSDVLAEKPTHVFRSCTGVVPVRFLITFGARNELIVELLPVERIAPDTAISVFRLTSGAQPLDELRASFGCSVAVDWRGFAPLWRYEAYGNIYYP